MLSIRYANWTLFWTDERSLGLNWGPKHEMKGSHYFHWPFLFQNTTWNTIEESISVHPTVTQHSNQAQLTINRP